jgi:sugar lactone lactonase YvrE
MKTKMLTLLATATFSAVGIITHAQSAYIGNSLSTNGGPGGPPPLVILGEYSPTSPLAAASPGTTLPGRVVADVEFYGQNYNFTLYALSPVAAGPKTNEQTFRVVASESFSGSATNPALQTLPASGFLVNAGDLLAFAGIGPYYATNGNDTLNSDATYEDSAYPGYLTATPPRGPGSQFSVGLHGDTNANYEYIPDSFGNQGRTYAIGVDVTSGSLSIAPLAAGTMQVALAGPAGLSYVVAASSNLNAPNWLTLTNVAAATNGTALFVDASAANFSSRFYRAQLFRSILTNDIITTFAGGGPGTTNLAEPFGIAVDASGDLFISDSYNNVIRELSSNGILSTVGNGRAGFSGDGGPATNASLNSPNGNVAVDASGNLFIPDTANNRIRKVSTNGVITTVAGNGSFGYAGDGGAATTASLNYPCGVAVDAGGNVYIADFYNSRIRKLSANGIITTVAGNGNFGFSGDGGPALNADLYAPKGVTVDASGNVFIADLGNNRIREVSTNGIITTVAGNGTAGYSGDGGRATAAELNYPTDVAVDASGNFYIEDAFNGRIRKVNTNGIISTVAGNGNFGFSGDGGPATSAALANPQGGVAVDASGNLFIGDTYDEHIRKVSTNGIITSVLGDGEGGYSGDGGPATNATLDSPTGLAMDTAGNLFIVDTSNERVRKVDTNGIITTVAGNGGSGFIGSFSGDEGPATNAALNDPSGGVAVDGFGNVFIADTSNSRIRKVSTNGVITTAAGNGSSGYAGDGRAATNTSLNYPWGVAVDNLGDVFIADTGNYRIREVTTNGIITTIAGNGPYGYSGDGGRATSAELASPQAVAVDSSGNLFIADTYNNRIRKVTDSIITTVAGNGTAGHSGDGGQATHAELKTPYAVAVDSSGNLFIADEGNYRIREVTTNGIITTVAGNSNYGFSGDGGPALNADLSLPEGLAVDASGNVFIADCSNSRVRKVTKP